MIGEITNRKLKLCPFCACYPVLENFVVEACVRCPNCKVKICARHDAKADAGIRRAQRAWNTRTSLTT